MTLEKEVKRISLYETSLKKNKIIVQWNFSVLINCTDLGLKDVFLANQNIETVACVSSKIFTWAVVPVTFSKICS